MEVTSADNFKENMKTYAAQVTRKHTPLKVTHSGGDDFVVIGAEDWEQEQETLYILQNNDLMKQIADSLVTHVNKRGYLPTDQELNEITGI